MVIMIMNFIRDLLRLPSELLRLLDYRIYTAFRDADVAKKRLKVAAVLGLGVCFAVAYGMWFDWHWKTMIGWKALVDYINPGRNDTTAKKETVQVYAVIVAGVIASITAAVGLLNLRLTRKNLEQQRELEAQRAQGTALQAYYEQIGKLLTDNELRTTQAEEIRELARGLTLTVLQELDASRKRSLLIFLYGAGLIETTNPAVALTGANLRGANLLKANLLGARLQGANLEGAQLSQEQLEDAFGDRTTRLPLANRYPTRWLHPTRLGKSSDEQNEGT